MGKDPDETVASTAESRPRLRDRLLGYDFFISYRSAEALSYATALEQLLRKERFRCFQDRREIVPGDVLWDRIRSALGRSSAMLVIATPSSNGEGNPVIAELDHFATLKRNLVIAIDIQGGLQADSPLMERVGARLRVIEKSPATGAPSPEVVAEIVRSARFIRSSVLRFMAALFLAAVFAVIALIAVLQTNIARKERARAEAGEQVAKQRLASALAVAREVNVAVDRDLWRIEAARDVRRSVLDRVNHLLRGLQAEGEQDTLFEQRTNYLALGNTAFQAGDFALASDRYKLGVEATRALLVMTGGNHRELLLLADSHYRLALSYSRMNKDAEARQAFLNAKQVLDQLCAKDCDLDQNTLRFRIERALGADASRAGRSKQATEAYQRALVAVAKALDLSPMDRALRVDSIEVRRQLASSLLAIGDSTSAFATSSEAIAGARTLLASGQADPEHLELLAACEVALSNVELRRGEIDRVIGHLTSALEARTRAANGKPTEALARAQRDLGLALLAYRGAPAAAAPHLAQFKATTQVLPQPDREALESWLLVADGDLALARGEWEAAAQLLTQVIERDSKSAAPDTWLLAQVEKELGDALASSGRLQEAVRHYTSARAHLAERRKRFPESTSLRAYDASVLAALATVRVQAKDDTARVDAEAAVTQLQALVALDGHAVEWASELATARRQLSIAMEHNRAFALQQVMPAIAPDSPLLRAKDHSPLVRRELLASYRRLAVLATDAGEAAGYTREADQLAAGLRAAGMFQASPDVK